MKKPWFMECPLAICNFIEIAREIDKTGVKLLWYLMSLLLFFTESEAAQLISVMKKISESGIAIIFITHRLDEVMAASNSITILRDGSWLPPEKRQKPASVRSRS